MSQNQAQKLVFRLFLQFGALVFFQVSLDDSLEQCLTTSRDKTQEKKFRGLKLGRKLVFHFLKFASFIFLDIEQDCSLGHCLTFSRAETSKTTFVAQIRALLDILTLI